MNQQSYEGVKAFFRYEGDQSVGNCGACHTLSEFTDAKRHVAKPGGPPTPTPSLRNLNRTEDELRASVRSKMMAGDRKRTQNADDVDAEYAKININDQDVDRLVAFLNLLNDVPDADFRRLIVNSELLDTSEGSE